MMVPYRSVLLITGLSVHKPSTRLTWLMILGLLEYRAAAETEPSLSCSLALNQSLSRMMGLGGSAHVGSNSFFFPFRTVMLSWETENSKMGL